LTSRIGTDITAKYRKRGLINPELFEYVFSWMWRCNAGHLCARAVSEQRRLNRLKGSKKEPFLTQIQGRIPPAHS